MAQWFAVLSIGLGLPLTLVLAPLVSRAILARVRKSMQLASTRGGGANVLSEPKAAAKPPGAPHPVQRVTASSLLSESAQQTALLSETHAKRRRIARAYAVGGALHALLLTAMFLNSLHDKGIATGVFTAAAIALLFALPTVATVASVVSGRPRIGMVWGAGGLLALLLVAGQVSGVLWSVFALYLLVPAVLFVVLNLRHWRAVAPLMLLLVLTGVLGWLAFMQLGRSLVGNSTALWLFRIGGAAVGVAIALPWARFIGRRYRARAIGEQELAIDTWFALYTYIEMVLFVALNPASSGVYFAGASAALAAFWIVKRALLRGVRDVTARPRRLLVLRVFRSDERAERLLEQLSLHWRPLGSVALIAGPDLALRTIDAQDVYTFLTGGLAREFVQGEADFAERLAALDERQDPEGRFPVMPWYCHEDTWRLVFGRLAAGADAILMDLRGFNADRRGCRHEIAELGALTGDKPIVLLIDTHTDVPLVNELLALRAGTCTPTHGHIFLLEVESDASALPLAIRLLLGARAA